MINHTLMIQGTTSDAGRSTLVTALCRHYYRKKINVAPFKPQNMALNSAVTVDGGEIGRAQAVQAMACGLPPHSDMNPILLKPNSDCSAQVIVHGQALHNLSADHYHQYKKQAKQAVMISWRRLQQQYDKIIVEGAGSPAEINLRENDIANMGFAEAADCPVILIADIDRGGVFAHLVGTLELLSTSERERVIGFVINRFRGDISLLQPGLDWLEKKTGKPVLAVLPYIMDLFLEAEDAIQTQSVAEESRKRFTVVIPRLPRISNHTDFDALRLLPNVELVYAAHPEQIKGADLIILPGSKSVRDDLAWLKQQQWPTYIHRHLRYQGKVLGICGGYQMLGNSVDDPFGVEGEPGKSVGLGLLDVETVLQQQKQLKQLVGDLCFAEAKVSAYEIHAGETQGSDNARPVVRLANYDDGAVNADNNVMGTYLHGVFDQPEACKAILNWAGFGVENVVDIKLKREQGINLITDVLEQHFDFETLTAVER